MWDSVCLVDTIPWYSKDRWEVIKISITYFVTLLVITEMSSSTNPPLPHPPPPPPPPPPIFWDGVNWSVVQCSKMSLWAPWAKALTRSYISLILNGNAWTRSRKTNYTLKPHTCFCCKQLKLPSEANNCLGHL